MMMNIGYIRVSTDKQTLENQRYEIERYAERKSLTIDKWVEETISGTKEVEKRELGSLMKRLKSGDTLICTEMSRLGRSLLMIMSVLERLMKKNVSLITIKDNYELTDSIQAKVLAFAFGLAAEIERNLISQRTKEALALRKANGVVLGRPRKHDKVVYEYVVRKGHRNDHYANKIAKALNNGKPLKGLWATYCGVLETKSFSKFVWWYRKHIDKVEIDRSSSV